jgi:hypothetical protein
MLRRLLIGLTEGLVIGLALGLSATRLLGLATPGSIVAALLGALAGFAVGLVAGRPIWARNAKTEALLKAGAGALAGFGLSFALRRWLKVELDLSAYSLGAGPAGQLSALALPAIATVLALFFELDDDGSGSATRSAKGQAVKRRVEGGNPDLASLDEADESAEEVEHKLEKH